MKQSNRLNGPGLAEVVVEKSRFIAYVRPVSDKEEAQAWVEALPPLARALLGAEIPFFWIGDPRHLPDGTRWTEFYRTQTGYLLRFPELADFQVSADGLHASCCPAP